MYVFLGNLLFSETEPYWNDGPGTVTRYNPWYLINCEFDAVIFFERYCGCAVRGSENSVAARTDGHEEIYCLR